MSCSYQCRQAVCRDSLLCSRAVLDVAGTLGVGAGRDYLRSMPHFSTELIAHIKLLHFTFPPIRPRMNESSSNGSLLPWSDRHDYTRLLYDALALMSTFKPSSGFRSTPKTDWHRFLDYLCWLCDYKRGGQTVTSIATEQTARASIFWIASNGNDIDQPATHLDLILTHLGRLREASESEAYEIAYRIYTESITFSRLRVHDYCQKLKRCIAVVEAKICDASDRGRSHFIYHTRFLGY